MTEKKNNKHKRGPRGTYRRSRFMVIRKALKENKRFSTVYGETINQEI